MLQVFIQPLDTVFFRDHRPFEAGTDINADSMLPSPLTVFGFIGSSYLEKKGTSLKDFREKGDKKLGHYDTGLGPEKTKIRVVGPFFAFEGKHYFPPPANLWSSGKNTRIHYLIPRNKNEMLGDWDGHTYRGADNIRLLKIPTFSHKDSIQPEPLKEYLPSEYIKTYLNSGEIEGLNLSARGEEDFFADETRFGIAINKPSKTAAEGYLYSARHLRFREHMHARNYDKAGFLVFVEGLEKSDLPEGLAQFGGEGRKVFISSEELGTAPPFVSDRSVIKTILDRKRFFLYFLTPSIFNNGWLGDWCSEDFKGFSLVGAVVNKPFFISGWSRDGNGAGGRPRGLFKAVPAGSVYFFEANEEWDIKIFESFYDKYHFVKSFSDHYKNAGFGTALIGAW